jgi:hypothetical protein
VSKAAFFKNNNNNNNAWMLYTAKAKHDITSRQSKSGGKGTFQFNSGKIKKKQSAGKGTYNL